jgi:hypothetical protein
MERRRRVRYVVAGVVILVGYAIAAAVFAVPIYFVLALFHRGVAVIPDDQGDLLTFLAIGSVFYLPSLLTAPGRLRAG